MAKKKKVSDQEIPDSEEVSRDAETQETAAPPADSDTSDEEEGSREFGPHLHVVGYPVHFYMQCAPTKTPTEHKNEHGRVIKGETVEAGQVEPRAAVITRLNEDGTVNLAIFDDEKEQVRWKKSAKFSKSPQNGCWNHIDD